MIIVAGGDSFIWGSELADSPHGGVGGFSQQTFPAILAKKSKNDYICAAYPGNANNAISRISLTALKNCNNPFLIVCWTFPQRAEFRFQNKWVSINSWHTVEEEFSKSYFKYAGDNEYYEIYSSLKEILFTQQYCQLNKIPYLFLTSNNYFYQHENFNRSHDEFIDMLYNNINWDNWFWFPPGKKTNETNAPRGFYQWAVENKYKVGIQGHPLEEAHKDAANLIEEKFNELVTKHYKQN